MSDRYSGSREGSWRINHWLACEASGPAEGLRSDPDAHARVIGLLESYGWITPVTRGGWTISPATGDA